MRFKHLRIAYLTFATPPTLGIYKCTFSHKKLGIPKDHLATKTLPHLVSLSIDNNLNLNQVPHRQAHMRTFTFYSPANLLKIHITCL